MGGNKLGEWIVREGQLHTGHTQGRAGLDEDQCRESECEVLLPKIWDSVCLDHSSSDWHWDLG